MGIERKTFKIEKRKKKLIRIEKIVLKIDRACKMKVKTV